MAADAAESIKDGPGQCQSPGLVHYSTSDTRSPEREVVTPAPDVCDGALRLAPDLARLLKMRSNVLTGSRLHQQELQAGGFRYKAAMVTLTYRPEVEWEARHISDYIKACREWFRRHCPAYRFRYVWVLELTKAGKPHYHVMIWLPKGVTLPKPDKRGWWPHGFTRIEWARNPVGYLAKYASKGSQYDHPLPKGARVYGVGGLSAWGRNVRAWWNLPNSVRYWGDPGDRVRRGEGSGSLRFLSSRDYVYRSSTTGRWLADGAWRGWALWYGEKVTRRSGPGRKGLMRVRQCVGGGWVKQSSGEWWPSLWQCWPTARGLIIVTRGLAYPPQLSQGADDAGAGSP